VARRLGTLPGSLMPAQESMVQGGRMSTLSAGRTAVSPLRPTAAPTLTRPTRLTDGPQILQFLKR